jgi:hypothetical protein
MSPPDTGWLWVFNNRRGSPMDIGSGGEPGEDA